MTWWAAYVEPKKELAVRDMIVSGLALSVFCPYEKVIRRRKVARQNKYTVEQVDLPLWPRYLFVDSDADRIGDIRRTRFVISMVSSAEEPLSVPDDIMEQLQSLAGADGLVRARDLTKPDFHGEVGDSVKLTGVLDGLVGHIASLSRLDESGIVGVWVSMLGADREVQVPYQTIELTR